MITTSFYDVQGGLEVWEDRSLPVVTTPGVGSPGTLEDGPKVVPDGSGIGYYRTFQTFGLV